MNPTQDVHRVHWQSDDLPTGPLVVWRGTAHTDVREVRYVPEAEVTRLREELIALRIDAGELVRCESCRMTEDYETATESWAHSQYDGTWQCADCFHDDGGCS